MSTHKSQNLNLHLWEPNDDFLRTEFNENFTAVDAAVHSAQGTADAALSKASAAYTPDQKPYVVGSYYGTGQTMTIELGFRPSYLIIDGAKETYPVTVETHAAYYICTAGNVLPNAVTFTSTGFTVNKYASSTTYPALTERRTYDYIAFR